MLLRLDFVLECPGGALDKRELCRFGTGMNASAPGIVSSVKPILEFGAFAMKAGGGGGMLEGEVIECKVPGDPAHTQGGEFFRAIESMLAPRGVCGDLESGIGLCCFGSVTRHDSISSSSIGVAPRFRKGALPFLYRHHKNITTANKMSTTDPRTDESIIISLRRSGDMFPESPESGVFEIDVDSSEVELGLERTGEYDVSAIEVEIGDGDIGEIFRADIPSLAPPFSPINTLDGDQGRTFPNSSV